MIDSKKKRNCRQIAACGLCMAVLLVPPVMADEKQGREIFPGNKDRHLREAAKYRAEFDNDVAFNSDNQFSNGWSFQVHTPVAESWDAVEGPIALIKKIGAWLPSLTAPGLQYRMSGSIGQIIQTPDEIENPNLITDDVPYAGVLTLKSTWIAYNDEQFRGFEFVFGVLGRPSMAEQTQNFVHNLIDTDIAQGWDNQLKNELVVNFNYMRKKKFYRRGDPAGFAFDATVNGDIQLGTLFTAVGARLETRFGTNMPRGFAYRADPIGRFLTYDATLAPPNPNTSSMYGTFSIGAVYSAHSILLDGNVFRDTVHSVEKEDVVGVATLGFHYERRSWGLHFDINLTTDTIDTDEVVGNPDPDNNFSTIMFEWRI